MFRLTLLPAFCVVVLTETLGAQSCAYGPWSTATHADTTDYPLRNVELIDVDGRLGLVANPIARFDSLPLQSPAAEFRGTDGMLMPLPRGGTRFAFPKVVSLGRSGLLAVWGEGWGDGPVLSREWPLRLVRIMWSRFTPGSGWTVASTLVSGETTLWSHLAPHAVAAARDGTVHVAVPGSRGIRLFTYAQGGWTSTSVPGVRAAATAALILADAGRSLVLGYLAALPGTRYDVNSVFVTSSNGGRTWRDPRLLARSGSFEAFDLRAVIVRGGSVALIWLRESVDRQITLTSVSSRDAGVTWQQPVSRLLPAGASELRVAVDQCGSVHAVYDHWHGGDSGHVDYVRLESGTWSSIKHLPVRGAELATGFAAVRDALHLFGVRFRDPPSGRPTRSYYARTILQRTSRHSR